MPATPVHVAVQALATRVAVPKSDYRWMLVGCILPDIPWILRRILGPLGVVADPLQLTLYSTVQATLLFSLIASIGLAAVAHRPKRSFVTLALGASLHLLLDGVETKWGNSPDLFAPFAWGGFELDLFWPEHPVSYLLAAGGLVYLAVAWERYGSSEIPIDLSSPARMLIAGLCCVAYFAGPPLLMQEAERHDRHSVRTLKGKVPPAGAYLELDRDRYVPTDSGGRIRAYAGRWIRTDRSLGRDPAVVSLRGRLLETGELHVQAYHVHHDRARDVLSVLGLIGIAAIWMRALIRTYSSPFGSRVSR